MISLSRLKSNSRNRVLNNSEIHTCCFLGGEKISDADDSEGLSDQENEPPSTDSEKEESFELEDSIIKEDVKSEASNVDEPTPVIEIPEEKPKQTNVRKRLRRQD